MNNDTSRQATFARAADRRAHELARLSDEKRLALAKEVEAMREQTAHALEQARERQAAQRDDDMASARQKVTTERQQLNYRPWWMPGTQRLGKDRVEELAAREVETANSRELSCITDQGARHVEQHIDAFLAVQPVFQEERASTDWLRSRWSEMREATCYDGHSESPDKERDPGRER